MSSADTSFRSHVWLSYHQIHLRALDEPLPRYPAAFPNGLIALDEEPDGATILTGISMGLADVTVQLAGASPPLDLDSWDEVVEVSIESTTGSLYVCGLDGDLPKDLPNLATGGEGFYRLRVHAVGRDTNVDGTARTPTEHYLIISWPASPESEIVYKTSDAYGERVRNRPRRRTSGE
ncbi:hypothetical protein ACIBO5_45925 [Nonomuraea angiospora]|uniref:hypothetical protein n=1 Tax=Nonomuraea angiospora TaxID=46172 RepID=UPI0037B75526